MVVLLIMVAAGVQAEARWNVAQRAQKVMTKHGLKLKEKREGGKMVS